MWCKGARTCTNDRRLRVTLSDGASSGVTMDTVDPSGSVKSTVGAIWTPLSNLGFSDVSEIQTWTSLAYLQV